MKSLGIVALNFSACLANADQYKCEVKSLDESGIKYEITSLEKVNDRVKLALKNVTYDQTQSFETSAADGNFDEIMNPGTGRKHISDLPLSGAADLKDMRFRSAVLKPLHEEGKFILDLMSLNIKLAKDASKESISFAKLAQDGAWIARTYAQLSVSCTEK